MSQKPFEVETSRRRFIRDLTVGTVALGGALGVTGCGGGSGDGDENSEQPAERPVAFTHGVASGDPLSDRVILWTRASRSSNGAVELRWEVALDAGFADIVRSGTAFTDTGRDYTVKVDADGLEPGHAYHFRFRAGASVSPVGRTRTLPTGTVSQVRLAVFSCANYPAGYFNAYAAAARMGDLDVAVHLGDYLYEYARGGYADSEAAKLGRLSEPATEIVSLADYRMRHAQYRSDPDLQALHAALPMIAVWDDHELCNDAWRDGAQNHQPDKEGSFAARKAAALQAYFEWMPVRLPDASQPDRIYRSFHFGSLLSLHMLDTRVIGRDPQLELTDYLGAGGSFDAETYVTEVGAADRQLLGEAQSVWLEQQLRDSPATWQVLGQQVLMGRMQLPAPVLFNLLSEGELGLSIERYLALAAKALASPGTLTPEEQALLTQPGLPYNLDAWDGYQAARERVLTMAQALDKNLVVLAGDTHNAWASNLVSADGKAAGVEFATPSVSSPGFEAYLPLVAPAHLAAALEQLIKDLEYADTSRRGFMVITAGPDECRADWHYVPTIAARRADASLGKSLKVRPGAGQRRLVAA
ncbi:alkaline phosphatase D family protein [Aquabacterium sp. A7-Y]|uniref:alkaline phosphatase D family protein n=1 Tax=Aquabacterium sp. A7-Y TaxID=1349605 RepID=UPI00223E8AC4|nr:alkaline phosphatase D family protein [Aquabacterium sp. A7-Y]MCW7542051.1 alkaline phosphatase D family protein [Aquabacterium sp. A7-Y]